LDEPYREVVAVSKYGGSRICDTSYEQGSVGGNLGNHFVVLGGEGNGKLVYIIYIGLSLSWLL
jgi:hypothetical protein